MAVVTSRAVADPSNEASLRAWDGEEGAFWAANADRFDRAVAGYRSRLLDGARIAARDRVLDIGCGTGQTSRDAAMRAVDGSVLGVDLSSQMLAVAERLSAQAGLRNVSFLQADAQVHPFAAAGFDVAISRTGTMFFGDPDAAFANVAGALRPAGGLVMLVWQGPEPNEWLRELRASLLAGRDLPAPPEGVPGPFAFADPDRVREVLTGAGFRDVLVEDLRAPMWFGPDVDDALSFVLGVMGWMLEGLAEGQRREALDELHSTLSRHVTPDGVVFGSGAWLVTAVRS